MLQLYAHDVVTSIDKEDFASDATSIMTAQEESCVAHFALLNVAAQGGNSSGMVTKIGKTGDAAGGQRV